MKDYNSVEIPAKMLGDLKLEIVLEEMTDVKDNGDAILPVLISFPNLEELLQKFIIGTLEAYINAGNK